MNRIIPAAALLLVLGSGCSAPAPSRALFVGKLQSETLSVAEPGEFCREQHARIPPAPAGMERVCVSNACGWSDARLRVVERIAGSIPATVVRLRSVLGEWCRPVFIGTTSDPVLVVTAGVSPQTGLSRFETYRLIEVAPGQQAFVPHPSSLSLEPWSVDLRPLLKPIQPVSFESVDRISDRERAELLRLPYVCQQGTELTYCKAVYVSDLKTAVHAAGRGAAAPAHCRSAQALLVYFAPPDLPFPEAAVTDDLQAELERLRAENERLKKSPRGSLAMKVSEKGALSVYGMGRFPVTLYKEQWLRLLAMGEEIKAFIEANNERLKTKE